MLKKLMAALACVVLLTCAVAVASGGTAADPIATKSYVDAAFAQLNARASELARGVSSAPTQAAEALKKLDNLTVATTSASLSAQVDYAGYLALLDSGYYLVAEQPVKLTLKAGERVVVTIGSQFSLLSGSASIEGARAAVVVNVTSGGACVVGQAASFMQQYVAADGGLVGLQTANGAEVLVQGGYQLLPAMRSRHTDAALALQSLGLMRGTNIGFELERRATRLEGLIMFLRLIGEEQAALNYSGSHPFNDVPVWGGDAANKYVAYAYSKGYTSGVSATKFGTNDTLIAEQYTTFLLRALGFKDGADFAWDTATLAAVRLGIITDAERLSIDRLGFFRDGMAYLSYRSLSARTAAGATLLERLVASGAVKSVAAQGLEEIFLIGG